MVNALRKISLLLMLCCVGGLRAQVVDSLEMKRFGDNDMRTDWQREKETVLSSNRLAETAADMSQQVYIIQGDEIRKFGYSTLVDVLENIPGFRTSQPGNVFEGETFLMRGLVGNDHVKFLINGIPVKPEAVRGMPIASQLPVRQAERIEIILGSSSTSYGSEAMAGVINIVLPEVERPVFAWGDINLSSPNASDINLALGGKAGHGDKLINYEIFASSYRAADVPLLIPDDSITVDLSSLSPYERQQFHGDTNGLAERDDFKRESRLIGAYATFKGVEVLAMNMYREEHSAFGFNPLEHQYNDPSLTLGERINSVSLKYTSPLKNRFQSKYSVAGLTYRMLPNSAYFAITNLLSNGRNFMYARSFDFNADAQGVMRWNNQWSMAFGATADYSVSHPFTQYLRNPYKDDKLSFEIDDDDNTFLTGVIANDSIYANTMLDSTIFIDSYTKYDVAGFVHANYKSKSNKFLLESGLRVDYNSFKELIPLPKLGMVYRPNSKWNISFNYGKSYRAPRSYYIFNSYVQRASSYAQGQRLERQAAPLKSELLHGVDLGIQYEVNPNWKLRVGYYGHYLKNKIFRQVFLPTPQQQDSTGLIGFGYFNGSSYSFLNAISFSSDARINFKNSYLDFRLSAEYAKGTERANGVDDAPDDVIETSEYRFVPLYSGKFTLTYSVKSTTVSLRGTYLKTFVTDIFRVNNRVISQQTTNAYSNVDFLIHQQLFRQLSAFGGVYNVFNSVQGGIPSVELTDTWNFNPQYGRYFKIGLTFQLN